MGKIFFITGKSCTGKDTVFRALKQNSDLDLKVITGYTTRPLREGEREGGEYHFVDIMRFNELRSAGRVIEYRAYNTVYGVWYYFTVDDGSVNLAENSYLYIGTLESYIKTAGYYGRENVIPIYIEVETGKRLQRAIDREKNQAEPKYKEMCRRFVADEEDFDEEHVRAAGITKRYVNDDLDACLDEITRNVYKLMAEEAEDEHGRI